MSENLQISDFFIPELVFYFALFPVFFCILIMFTQNLVAKRAYFLDFFPCIVGKCIFCEIIIHHQKNMTMVDLFIPELVFYFTFFFVLELCLHKTWSQSVAIFLFFCLIGQENPFFGGSKSLKILLLTKSQGIPY